MAEKHHNSPEAMQASGMHTAKGHKSRKPRKKLRSTQIEYADNGGHIVTHRYSRSTGQDDGMFPNIEERHVFSNGSETLNHLGSHLMKGTNVKTQEEPPNFGGREAEQEEEA